MAGRQPLKRAEPGLNTGNYSIISTQGRTRTELWARGFEWEDTDRCCKKKIYKYWIQSYQDMNDQRMKTTCSNCVTWRRVNAGFKVVPILTALNEQAGLPADTNRPERRLVSLLRITRAESITRLTLAPAPGPSVRQSSLHGTPCFLREEWSPPDTWGQGPHSLLPFGITKPTLVWGVCNTAQA